MNRCVVFLKNKLFFNFFYMRFNYRNCIINQNFLMRSFSNITSQKNQRIQINPGKTPPEHATIAFLNCSCNAIFMKLFRRFMPYMSKTWSSKLCVSRLIWPDYSFEIFYRLIFISTSPQITSFFIAFRN